MSRPSCVVNIRDLPGEKRPRYTATEGVAATVRSPSDATGLTQMGVHVRAVELGFAGTNRHFHTIEEEWAYVLAGQGAVRIGPPGTISIRPYGAECAFFTVKRGSSDRQCTRHSRARRAGR